MTTTPGEGERPTKLLCSDGLVPLERAVVMGVLNVTPDSFSDGGMWLDAAAAADHGAEMAAQGAAMIDVGGESTRPGAEPVDEAEELRRVIPVIERLSERVDVPIAVDTRKPGVARRALEAGAALLNDTRGEDSDPAMDEIAAAADAGLVLMHTRGTPATMRSLTTYRDVVADVGEWLARRAGEARLRGVPPEAIVVDPGIGFAKTPDQNLELLRRLDELLALGYPLLLGTSRKSFMGAVLGLPVDQRLETTAATVAWAVARGAHIVRVHDVEPMVRVVGMIEAIKHSGASLQ